MLLLPFDQRKTITPKGTPLRCSHSASGIRRKEHRSLSSWRSAHVAAATGHVKLEFPKASSWQHAALVPHRIFCSGFTVKGVIACRSLRSNEIKWRVEKRKEEVSNTVTNTACKAAAETPVYESCTKISAEISSTYH